MKDMTQNIEFYQLRTSKTSMMTRDFLTGKWKYLQLYVSTTTLMMVMVSSKEKAVYITRDEERIWLCGGGGNSAFAGTHSHTGKGALKNGDREIIGSLFNGLASITTIRVLTLFVFNHSYLDYSRSSCIINSARTRYRSDQ